VFEVAISFYLLVVLTMRHRDSFIFYPSGDYISSEVIGKNMLTAIPRNSTLVILLPLMGKLTRSWFFAGMASRPSTITRVTAVGLEFWKVRFVNAATRATLTVRAKS
jgi:hypothetical protein